MAHVITFRSSRFDTAAETPNPINPIAGKSVLSWLSEGLGAAYEVTAPATEDWGWYVGVTGAGGAYLVGASAEPGEPGASVEWTVQIHRHRSLRDKLTGGNKLAPDDPLSRLIEGIIRAEPQSADVEVDRSG